MRKISNVLFAKSRSEFISELSGFCCVTELRFARDMVHSIAKRKIGNNNLSTLTERRSGANVKDNLLKDIYNLYSLGEGSIESFPKPGFYLLGGGRGGSSPPPKKKVFLKKI